MRRFILKIKQNQHKPCTGSACSLLCARIFLGCAQCMIMRVLCFAKTKAWGQMCHGDKNKKKKTVSIPQLQWIWSCTEMLHAVFNSKAAAPVWTNVCFLCLMFYVLCLKQDMSSNMSACVENVRWGSICVSMLERESSLLCGGGLIPGELRVDKGESLELILVQVLNHFLVRRGQHWRVACEKTVKVLCIPSTLLRRVERDEIQGGGGVGMDRSGWIAGVGQGEENKNRGSGGVNQGVRWHHLNMVSNTRKGVNTQSASIASFFRYSKHIQL